MGKLINRIAVLAATATVVMEVGLVPAARADTAPELACGSTQPGPCSQTAHFTDVNEVDSPPESPLPASCPSFLATDFVTVVGTGNGIEHVTVNKAQNFWFTSTFTGQVTITAYPPSSITATDDTFTVSGPPDPNVPVFTGKLTEWFGASGNRQSAVFHDTFHFSGTSATGESFTIHDVDHASYTPGLDQNGPPHTGFTKIHC